MGRLSATKWHQTPGWDGGYRMHYEKPWRRLLVIGVGFENGYEYATDEETAQIALKEKFDTPT